MDMKKEITALRDALDDGPLQYRDSPAYHATAAVLMLELGGMKRDASINYVAETLAQPNIDVPATAKWLADASMEDLEGLLMVAGYAPRSYDAMNRAKSENSIRFGPGHTPLQRHGYRNAFSDVSDFGSQMYSDNHLDQIFLDGGLDN